jgi:hypothetical protein
MPQIGSRVSLGELHHQIRLHSLHLRVRLLSVRTNLRPNHPHVQSQGRGIMPQALLLRYGLNLQGPELQ